MDKNFDKNHEENIKKGEALLNHLEEMQYSYFNGRPEWILLHKNDLKLFLAYIYYGYPSPSNAIVENNYEDEISSEELFKLYTNEIKKKILDIYELIEEKYVNPSLNSKTEVGITMIHSICKKKCDSCQDFPKKDIHKWLLLRLKLNSNKFIFIDFQNSRTYTGWDEYMENNNLPEGFMFYPKSGFYDASKTLYQTITPASKTSETVLKIADIASCILNVVGGIVMACGSIFLIGTPIAIGLTVAGSALTTVSSSYKFSRHVQQLIDMFRHDINQIGTNSWKHLIGLAISAIGAITAPILAISAITSEVNSTVQSTGKTLTIFRKSACITQCTLEVFRATLDFIDTNFKITWENVLKLRLDVFIVTGVLMAPSYITDILKLLAMQTVWVPIFKTIEQIPYCLGQYVWNNVYFFKNHFAMFVESVTKFLAENLTATNLLFAWKTIRCMFDGYQKQTSNLDIGDLLWHVVDGIAINESVKYVLRGQQMVKLLDSLRVCAPKKRISPALVKYCVDHVLREAKNLSALRDDCVADIARHGETRAWKVDEEFCKCYGLESCAMDQYALWVIGQVNSATLIAKYEKHSSCPKNMFNDEMVVNKHDAGWSAKGYSFVAPCSVLDLEMCLRFAEKVNPQPHQYLNHKLVQPEPAVSLMFGVSAYSVNIVFFGIDLINDVPKMNICFFEQNCDSGPSIANHRGFKKLQAA